MPRLRPVLAFILVTAVIGSFQVYGPVDATWGMNFYLFQYAFQQYHMGYPAAGAVVLFAPLFVVRLLPMPMMRAGEAD